MSPEPHLISYGDSLEGKVPNQLTPFEKLYLQHKLALAILQLQKMCPLIHSQLQYHSK